MKNDTVIKTLVRCIKMYEAKTETISILLKAQKRDALLHMLLDSIELMTQEKATYYYWTVLKNSLKLYNMVNRLRKDHSLLQRPFIHNGENL